MVASVSMLFSFHFYIYVILMSVRNAVVLMIMIAPNFTEAF